MRLDLHRPTSAPDYEENIMHEVREKATLWLREQRICTRCLSAPTGGVYNNCEACRDKRSSLKRNGTKRNPNPCRLIMRTIAKIEGICTQCFSHWADKERVQCSGCIERNIKSRKPRSRDPQGKFSPSVNNYQ